MGKSFEEEGQHRRLTTTTKPKTDGGTAVCPDRSWARSCLAASSSFSRSLPTPSDQFAYLCWADAMFFCELPDFIILIAMPRRSDPAGLSGRQTSGAPRVEL
jgi:hypothetical protein